MSKTKREFQIWLRELDVCQTLLVTILVRRISISRGVPEENDVHCIKLCETCFSRQLCTFHETTLQESCLLGAWFLQGILSINILSTRFKQCWKWHAPLFGNFLLSFSHVSISFDTRGPIRSREVFCCLCVILKYSKLENWTEFH